MEIEEEKAGRGKSVLLNVAFLSFVLSVAILVIGFMVNAYVVSHHAAYLGYFGIPADSINLSATQAEIPTYGLVVLICAIVYVLLLVVIPLLFFRLVNSLQRNLSRPKNKLGRFFSIDNGAIFTNGLIGATLTLIVIFIFFAICYIHPDSAGEEAAKNQASFFRIDDGDSEVYKVVIFQRDNVGVVKTLVADEGQFDDGYELMDLVDKKFRWLDISE